jgi:hypothetical protein
MFRSHVLLHCPNDNSRAARIIANPRWERRFLKFLELSGVGRVMADGTNEGGPGHGDG